MISDPIDRYDAMIAAGFTRRQARKFSALWGTSEPGVFRASRSTVTAPPWPGEILDPSLPENVAGACNFWDPAFAPAWLVGDGCYVRMNPGRARS